MWVSMLPSPFRWARCKESLRQGLKWSFSSSVEWSGSELLCDSHSTGRLRHFLSQTSRKMVLGYWRDL